MTPVVLALEQRRDGQSRGKRCQSPTKTGNYDGSSVRVSRSQESVGRPTGDTAAYGISRYGRPGSKGRIVTPYEVFSDKTHNAASRSGDRDQKQRHRARLP
jgi:hypothetical protein